MKTFGPLHLGLLLSIAAACVVFCLLLRRHLLSARAIRLAIGWGIIGNELIWWTHRYSHEGVHLWNLPFQLCDVTLWMSALACLTLAAPTVEFAYFGGLAGAGMVLLTPDLWSPWPTYPAIYFFVAHGGIVLAVSVLVFGRICPLGAGAVWRAFGMLLGFAAAIGAVDALTGANFMYLCRKPKGASLLDSLGPWPRLSGCRRPRRARHFLAPVAARAPREIAPNGMKAGCVSLNSSRRMRAAAIIWSPCILKLAKCGSVNVG